VTVVSVDFFDAVVSPVGETVVPLEVAAVDLVTTPLALVVRWLLVSTATEGATITGAVVVSVVVELEEEDCAKAAPVIRVAASVAASIDFIMWVSPGTGGIRCSVIDLG